MRNVKKTIGPTCILLIILFLWISTFYQTALAAMVETDKLLTSSRHPEIRNQIPLRAIRAEIRKKLVAHGINPQEARLRIDSLSDAEIELIAEKTAYLPAGGGVAGFILIVGGVVLALIIIVEYNSEIRMFPNLPFRN